MNRFTFAAILVSLAIASPMLLAQDNSPIAQQRMQEASARLNLSDEQEEELAPIMQSSLQAQQEILARYGIDMQGQGQPASRLGFRQARAMKSELDVVREATLNDLAVVLDDAQMAEFQRMQDERRAEMRERIRVGR